MSVAIKISVNEGLYLKEPQNSTLGKKILKKSIILIDKNGFEAFTFKKLAEEIHSTEASIYRYFKNKHILLLYLFNWYWEWVNYLIIFNTKNITAPSIKLKIILHSFLHAQKENPSTEFINESALHNIVISEGGKAYHTKMVDDENSKGFFSSYISLVNYVSKIIKEINPTFKYPNALASNLFEMSNNQVYFARHIPSLNEVSKKEEDLSEVEKILNYFTEILLEKRLK